MATQGRPNISLLPIAGAEITRARERQQAVGLQAALARLQAQAQAARLQEQAREFDVNAQLRQEATALDERFRQQQLSFRQQQFQQQSEQVRFGQELSIQQLGLQGQKFELQLEQERRIAEQAGQEFGLRSRQHELALRKVETFEKQLSRTEGQKTFQLEFESFRAGRGTLFTVSEEGALELNPEAEAPLERMAEAFNRGTGRNLSIGEFQQFLNPLLTRATEDRQTQLGQQQLAADVQRQNIQESQSRVLKNVAPPEARARATPEQEIARTFAEQELRLAGQLELNAQSLELSDEDRQQMLKRAEGLRGRAEGRLRAAIPVADPLAPTREEQLQQLIGRPQVAGAPTAAEQAAAPTDFEAQTLQDVRRFRQEIQEEAQGFQSPSQAASTISAQDRTAMQGYINNGLRVLDAETQDVFFGDLLERLDKKKSEVQEAFAEKNQDPPDRIIQALNAQTRQLRSLRSQGQDDIENTRRGQQQALNNLTGEGAIVLRAQLVNEHAELGGLIKRLEGRQDAAADDIEREQFQGQIDGANKTLAHLGEMRSKVAEKASQSRKEFFNVDRAGTTIKATFRGIPATDPEIKGVMSELNRDIDPIVAEEWGQEEFISGLSGSRDARRRRGQQYIRWLREGGIWDTLGSREQLTGLAAENVIFKQATVGFLPQAIATIREAFTGEATETTLLNASESILPIDQREVFQAALDRLDIKPKIERDPQTGEDRIIGAAEGEPTREELIRIVQIQLNQEDPRNVIGWQAALFIKGRDKGIDPVDIWQTIAPFDYNSYIPDPRRATRPTQNGLQVSRLFAVPF